jgi:hypothetical protein
MGALQFKPGVIPGPLTLAGAAILGALARTAIALPFDLVVTSAADGPHSGPDDPHHLGNAFDVRSHEIPEPQKTAVLKLVMHDLSTSTHQMGRNPILVAAGEGLATECFYGELEAPGEPNEHFHFQLRKGRAFAPKDVPV